MSTTNIEQILNEAQKKINLKQYKEALKTLKPLKKKYLASNSNANSNSQHVLSILPLFATCYLETDNIEKAYPILLRCCELDPDGVKNGCESFLTLGQIMGGELGLKYLTKGVEIANNQKEVPKVVNGILAMIEVWMTDLCMEPNAEQECEGLINKAMEISQGESPEVWSVLGSIRISQQRFNEAAECFVKSWKYFQTEKLKLEENLSNQTIDHDQYIGLVQPLLNCSKMCIEMGLYETSIEILSAVKDIDEDNLEALYLEGFTNYLMAKVKQQVFNNGLSVQTPEDFYKFNAHIQDCKLNVDDTNIDIQDFIYDSRVALSFTLKIGENIADPEDTIAQEIVQGAQELLFGELGGPIDDSELIKIKKGVEVDVNEDIEIEEHQA
ncbi:Acl4p SCDLUD_001786 [Saccharomycodes ludwigii]|uniref:Acl4p n=1 Tax=Saccharomycodes ludwigii TaxID=36035 RepID=UPI001E86C396|nr:hypothetical protein SCDLUD_001786 [Saccharomycodes ludwigii]KAH3901998.1 hypothetical protein SCDLUD_001786 [Saccharomycodes ludwigii]